MKSTNFVLNFLDYHFLSEFGQQGLLLKHLRYRSVDILSPSEGQRGTQIELECCFGPELAFNWRGHASQSEAALVPELWPVLTSGR